MALVLGLASPLAMVDPLLWVVPPAGVAFSGAALWRIARARGGLLGRKAALVGLTLSVWFAVAAPTHWIVYRRLVREEAREFARCWFEFLAEGRPRMAHQLTVKPEKRQPLDERLKEHYARGSELGRKLDSYVSRPPVSTLLELGSEAEFRYVDTTGQARTAHGDTLYQLYAVGGGRPEENEVFFLVLALERVKLKTGQANWRLKAVFERSDLREER